MLYTISLAVICSGFIFSRSKTVFCIIMLWTFVVFGFNTENPDYVGYRKSYNSLREVNGFAGYLDNQEYGYRYLVYLGNHFNLPFYIFFMIIAGLGLALIAVTILRFSNAPACVAALYGIYPLLMDVVQIRNFLCMSVIIFCSGLLFSNRLRDLILYCIGIAIAGSLQSIGYFYVLLILCRLKKRSHFVWAFWGTAIALLIMLLAVPRSALPSALTQISYFDLRTSTATRVSYAIYFIFGFLSLYYAQSQLSRGIMARATARADMERELLIIERTYRISVIALLAYPLMYYVVDFIRIHRNLQVLAYILFGNVFVSALVPLRSRLLALVCAIIVAGVAMWTFTYYIGRETIFEAILENNWLFHLGLPRT